jgi:hypothetical protein
MPQQSKTFEFYNPYSTKNTHTTQCSITMPQMVNGRKPPPSLTLFSTPVQTAGWYGLGQRDHLVAYVVEGSFKGTCTIQVSTTPAPGENDWVDLAETQQYYYGIETTGGAGISGGFSGAVSHPTKTNILNFNGDYAWARAKLDICRGTLQAIKLNF